MIAAQVACVGWAVGSSYARSRGAVRAATKTCSRPRRSRCCSAASRCSIARLALHETARLTFTPRTAAALTYLIFVGAIGGFSAYAYALKHLPVATVSLYAYVNPIIAVVLGTLVLQRTVRRSRPALAAAIVFAGVVAREREMQPARSRSIATQSAIDLHVHRLWLRPPVRPLISRTRNSTMATTSST